MRFKGLDLNLLVTLDCLLTERNVSRAAEKLCLSQSATSGALTRLREYFGDELLLQLGRTMVMTPRAVELLPAVRSVLLQVEGTIIKRPEFDPLSAKREIRIIASDYMTITALSAALRAINREAPELTFKLTVPGESPQDLLDRAEVEFLAMPDVYLSPDHPSQRLFSEDYRAVIWSGNTLVKGDEITLSEFLHMRHVSVNYSQSGPTFEGWFIERFGNERLVEVTTSSYSTVPFLIVGTDRIALMHQRLANVFARMMPLKLLKPPVEIPQIHEALQWHFYNDSDECLTWVRNRLIEHISTHISEIELNGVSYLLER
ncbi:LysR family nod box-dependent transcriptional activator [Rhizobium sp. SG_E_25_P2]|uniref:LysR family transcriptional regulator n=1 Tax=Rhizobium sp. SG_E_25_P2 TaxID=2879942 RepID=UPI002473C288|nr:LysR family transcriptional regulator [Rhizobium sp. SG_E_25_P2]MDH6266038.1 LysR family nod box-dependent transcriptional activator [Rhizobium sp. SG_E_25_P2]